MDKKFELKPCPFCGGEAHLYKDVVVCKECDEATTVYVIGCNTNGCICDFGPADAWCESKEDIILAWNTRKS